MSFPISLDNFTEQQDAVDDIMAEDINELQAAVEALEAKVGIDNSAVVTSIDYRLSSLEDQKGVADGLATLDSAGKVPTSQLPALAITDTFVVANEAEQLLLTAQEGDVAVRSDENKSYIHNGGTAGTMADWQELLTPTDAVLSVAGKTGAVSLEKADVGLGNVTNEAQIAKAIGTAAGDIIYFTGNATPARLAKGTAGQVLTMNAGATAPEWADASGGETMDPTNLIAPTIGYLTGGTGHSDLSIFQTLGNGSDDGKIKINIDGVEYDDLAINLLIESSQGTLINQLSGSSATAGGPSGQSFTLSKKTKIISLSAYFNSVPSSASATIRAGQSMGGTIVGESTSATLGSPTIFYFGDGVVLEAGTYTFAMEHATGYVYFDTSNPYAGGAAFIQGAWRGGYDIKFSVIAAEYNIASSLDDVASQIQSAIQTVTGSTETVTYDTDHFVITSVTAGIGSKILRLMTPSTGTDISGAGATPYLDCAANATETLGDSDAGKTVILDALGELTIRKYNLSALNTAPASAVDTGTLGEIRVTADHIYVCTATNTWKRIAIATW